jgi:hypothetical protein
MVQFHPSPPKKQALSLGQKPGLFAGVTLGLHLPAKEINPKP